MHQYPNLLKFIIKNIVDIVINMDFLVNIKTWMFPCLLIPLKVIELMGSAGLKMMDSLFAEFNQVGFNL